MRHYSKSLGLAAIICAAAITRLSAQERPALPDGVIHVALPPGPVRLENITRNKKPLLRLTAGKLVIETNRLFLGDFKGAQEIEATKLGMNWVTAKGRQPFYIDGVDTHEPGSTTGADDYQIIAQLKPGSLLVTTPSIKFVWGRETINKKLSSKNGERNLPVMP
jgi:hypothetical protein